QVPLADERHDRQAKRVLRRLDDDRNVVDDAAERVGGRGGGGGALLSGAFPHLDPPRSRPTPSKISAATRSFGERSTRRSPSSEMITTSFSGDSNPTPALATPL